MESAVSPKSGEVRQVSSPVQPGQTAVMDRGYQDHERFDQWQEDSRHFICRIKENTHRTVLEELPLASWRSKWKADRDCRSGCWFRRGDELPDGDHA